MENSFGGKKQQTICLYSTFQLAYKNVRNYKMTRPKTSRGGVREGFPFPAGLPLSIKIPTAFSQTSSRKKLT